MVELSQIKPWHHKSFYILQMSTFPWGVLREKKMGSLGNSFLRNVDIWKEILKFEGFSFLFVHKNK